MSIAAQSMGRATVSSWAGRSGFERLLADIDAQVGDPGRFRAEERHFDVDGMRLIDWRSSPMSIHRHPASGPDSRSVTLVLIASGRVRYTVGDLVFTGGSGSLHLVAAADALQIDLLDMSRALAVRLPFSQLPAPIRAGQTVHSGVINPSVFTPGFSALIGSLLGSRDVAALGLHGVIALRALATAVLTEQLPPDTGDMEGLRRRMILHIELHLADPDLGPRSIAEAFGVSLRWVHMVFNTGDVSVARFIREARVDAVAAAVRSDLRLMRGSSLATAYGFAGRDQLTRAFRARYGMSVPEYQEIASRGGTLPSPGGSAAADADEHVPRSGASP